MKRAQAHSHSTPHITYIITIILQDHVSALLILPMYTKLNPNP